MKVLFDGNKSDSLSISVQYLNVTKTRPTRTTTMISNSIIITVPSLKREIYSHKLACRAKLDICSQKDYNREKRKRVRNITGDLSTSRSALFAPLARIWKLLDPTLDIDLKECPFLLLEDKAYGDDRSGISYWGHDFVVRSVLLSDDATENSSSKQSGEIYGCMDHDRLRLSCEAFVLGFVKT